MSKNRVLGRGLGNLIANAPQEAASGNYIELKISEIITNPNQPRKTFSEESIRELAETIKDHGVIQPVVVKKTDKGYELISGERRLRASKFAGFVKIPAIIKNVSDKDSMLMAVIENIQREDLNPVDEAMAYQELMDKLSMKPTDIASRIGKNRSTVANLIRLLQLPSTVLEMVKSGKLSEGQARPLISIADKRKIEDTANKILQNGWTVRQIEEYVSSLLDEKKPLKTEKTPTKKHSSILDIESKIRKKVSGKISLDHNEKSGKGKIVIHYNNLKDLDRVLENLGINL